MRALDYPLPVLPEENRIDGMPGGADDAGSFSD